MEFGIDGGGYGYLDNWQRGLDAFGRNTGGVSEPENLLPGTRAEKDKEAQKEGRYDGFGSKKECESCNNRKYQDGSDDSTVSFQSPTRIGVKEAASAVASHEREHVVHEQGRARREGRKIIHQSVAIHTAVCPECGTPYVSGGTTRTVTSGPDPTPAGAGGAREELQKGRFLDKTA